MTKLETIIKAWADLDIKTPFGICNNTGHVISYCINGIDDILSEFPNIKDKIEFEHSEYLIKWRPKSLQGIEDNNGWSKTLEDGLPKTTGEYIFLCPKKIQHTVFISNPLSRAEKSHFKNDFTHYKPVKNEPLPLY